MIFPVAATLIASASSLRMTPTMIFGVKTTNTRQKIGAALEGPNIFAGTAADGLAGVQAPTLGFDPLGFASTATVEDMYNYRAAELKHGRLCMLATLGITFSDHFHMLKGQTGPLETGLIEKGPTFALEII